MMDAELGGNGIRAPTLYKVTAKNLRFEIFTYRQWSSPSIKGVITAIFVVCRVAAAAESHF